MKHKKYFFILLLAVVILLVSCTRLDDIFIQPLCPTVVTYACEDKNQSNCRDFPTGCLPDGWSEKEKPAPTNGLTLPDKERCKTTEYGWACILLSENNPKLKTLTREEARVLEQPLKELCEKQNGIFGCSGFCRPDYTRYCKMLLPDAGKECVDSSQCMGNCVTKDYKCKTNCEGKCTNSKLTFCEYRIELHSGEPKREGAICD